jgi:hypothetical protein
MNFITAVGYAPVQFIFLIDPFIKKEFFRAPLSHFGFVSVQDFL